LKLKAKRVKYIAYYRVSTQKQGKSKLGLEAQEAIVKAKIKENNGDLVAEYTEIESGKINNRPALALALDHARECGAVLIIAKLDRLSRNVEFIFRLRNAGVEFLCCDLPELNTLTLGIYATVAQYERERICERIKDALKAKKARGDRLGSPQNLSDYSRQRSAEVRKQTAREQESNQKAWRVIQSLKCSGMSYRNIVDKLNEYGLVTVKGRQFKLATVQRVIRMYK